MICGLNWKLRKSRGQILIKNGIFLRSSRRWHWWRSWLSCRWFGSHHIHFFPSNFTSNRLNQSRVFLTEIGYIYWTQRRSLSLRIGHINRRVPIQMTAQLRLISVLVLWIVLVVDLLICLSCFCQRTTSLEWLVSSCSVLNWFLLFLFGKSRKKLVDFAI